MLNENFSSDTFINHENESLKIEIATHTLGTTSETHLNNSCKSSDYEECNGKSFISLYSQNDMDNKIYNQEYKCFLCKRKYHNPRILLCLHSFCLECICKLVTPSDLLNTLPNDFKPERPNNNRINTSPFFQVKFNLFDKYTNAINVKCPICHATTKEKEELIPDLVAKLPKNFIIHDILTLNDLKETALTKINENTQTKEKNAKELYCTSCKLPSPQNLYENVNQVNEKIAIGRCVECALYLCTSCAQAHKFMRCFENHTVMSFKEIYNVLNTIDGSTTNEFKGQDGKESDIECKQNKVNGSFIPVETNGIHDENYNDKSVCNEDDNDIDDDCKNRDTFEFANDIDHDKNKDSDDKSMLNNLNEVVLDKSALALLNSLKCSLKCQSHPSEQVKYYCDTCQLLLCLSCLENHQPPSQHSCQLLDASLEEKHKNDLITDIFKTTKKSQVLEGHVSLLENRLFMLDTQQEDLRKKLTDYKMRCHELIDTYFDEATDLLGETHGTFELKVMEAFHDVKKMIESVEDSIKFARMTIKHCTISEILCLKPFINHRLTELGAQGLISANDKFNLAAGLNLTFNQDIPTLLESLLKFRLVNSLKQLETIKENGSNDMLAYTLDEKVSGNDIFAALKNDNATFLESIQRTVVNLGQQHSKPMSNLIAEDNSLNLNLPAGINPSSALATNIMGLAALAKLGNNNGGGGGGGPNDSSTHANANRPSLSTGPLEPLSPLFTNIADGIGSNHSTLLGAITDISSSISEQLDCGGGGGKLFNDGPSSHGAQTSPSSSTNGGAMVSMRSGSLDANKETELILNGILQHRKTDDSSNGILSNNLPPHNHGINGMYVRNQLSMLLDGNINGPCNSNQDYLTANLTRLLSLSSTNQMQQFQHGSNPFASCMMNTGGLNLNDGNNGNLIDPMTGIPPISHDMNTLHSTPPLPPPSATALFNYMHSQPPPHLIPSGSGALPPPTQPGGPPCLGVTSLSGGTYTTNGGHLATAVNGTPKMSIMKVRVKFGSLGPGNLQFNSPHGFCLGVDEEIIVADTNNHRIQVYTKAGAFKGAFGVPGRDEGQLWYPRKVAVNKMNGKFIVCDRGSERSRMQIFDRNGNFLKKVPIRYIDIVAGLAVTEVGSPGGAGHIIAVDSVTPTVFRIAESGDLLHWFDCSEHMREPSDVAVRADEYYVCDFKGHCVAVFAESGQFLRRIGREALTNFPNGIDVSEGGEVLVGDSHGNRFHVAVFRGHDGEFVAEFECPHVKVSRCCGLKITSEGHVVTLAKNNHYVLVLDTLFVPP